MSVSSVVLPCGNSPTEGTDATMLKCCIYSTADDAVRLAHNPDGITLTGR